MDGQIPMIVRGYCGYLREMSTEVVEARIDGVSKTTAATISDIVLVDTHDPRITIHMEGVTAAAEICKEVVRGLMSGAKSSDPDT